MGKTLRSIYTFYQNHFFVGCCISLSCMWMYHVLGDHAIPILCWYKAITQSLFVSFVNHRKKHEFYYYRNLGISKTLLWSVTLSIDFVLFICAMILAHKI